VDRAYFGNAAGSQDQVGYLDGGPARFGKSTRGAGSAREGSRPGRGDRGRGQLLPTIPNQLGVDYNGHVLESVLRHIAPQLGWR